MMTKNNEVSVARLYSEVRSRLTLFQQRALDALLPSLIAAITDVLHQHRGTP